MLAGNFRISLSPEKYAKPECNQLKVRVFKLIVYAHFAFVRKLTRSFAGITPKVKIKELKLRKKTSI